MKTQKKWIVYGATGAVGLALFASSAAVAAHAMDLRTSSGAVVPGGVLGGSETAPASADRTPGASTGKPTVDRVDPAAPAATIATPTSAATPATVVSAPSPAAADPVPQPAPPVASAPSVASVASAVSVTSAPSL
ncbi:hypothetical protein MUN78_08385 [Leucobacter allii]|uniref:Uncharacterized protein n=1 Tax=Leucobacter allii TaxID=2932247 RepID=A0ABY4FKG0_9MICO|nr:hypothetical protein [Leucobacter allii]UOQ55736.1 hypothetical protein MUN78_08385 [Leucobacter allii]